jgi:hypothetical protein
MTRSCQWHCKSMGKACLLLPYSSSSQGGCTARLWPIHCPHGPRQRPLERFVRLCLCPCPCHNQCPCPRPSQCPYLCPSCLKTDSQVHLSCPVVFVVALVEWSHAHHSQNLESTTTLTVGECLFFDRCAHVHICKVSSSCYVRPSKPHGVPRTGDVGTVSCIIV